MFVYHNECFMRYGSQGCIIFKYPPWGGMFSSAKKGTMKGRGKRGKREEKSERARGKGKKKGKKGGEGEEKEKKMEEISLNGGEGFQEASWGVGNVLKKFEEYTPLKRSRNSLPLFWCI